MLWLKSETDRPDFEWFKTFLDNRSHEGIRVERPVEKEKEAAQLANEAAKALLDECGIENPNSPKQIVSYMESLCDSDVFECCADPRTGKLSSAADGIATLAEIGHKWAMQLLKYRGNNSILKAVTSVMSCADVNGLIHPDISFQKTNRISYTSPALMNINKEILWYTVKPMKAGNYLWSADIKNQEPWILAHLTGATKLIELAEKAKAQNCSLYKAVYADIFGHEIESEDAYTEMKTAWNMLTYGGTLQGLLQRCKIVDGEKIYRYFNAIKELKDYRGRTFGLAKKGINTVNTVFGTPVYTDATGGHLQRSLMDIPVQGTGADILCMLVKHVTTTLEDEGLSDYIKVYFTRHDEIIFEVDKEWQNMQGDVAVAGEILYLTRHRIDNWVEFGVDVEQLNA